MNSSSDDDVRNFYRHVHTNEPRSDLQQGPASISDWYTEIGWILAALGVSEVTQEIIHHFNQAIDSISNFD
jgi:hypothetical protein